MLFVAKFCLGAWCQDVAEAGRGDYSGVIAVSTKISEKIVTFSNTSWTEVWLFRVDSGVKDRRWTQDNNEGWRPGLGMTLELHKQIKLDTTGKKF